MYVSAKQFAAALRRLEKPGGRQLEFLRAHSEARSGALTATMLGDSVGYASYRAINLLYGKLAKAVGAECGDPTANLSLLCEFLPPRTVTNQEWILIMRSEFKEGLRLASWVDRTKG